ncbi:MAG: type II secretion system protein GspJ [Sphingomonadaceae bacterium]
MRGARQHATTRGFTLVEVLVAFFLFSLVAVAITALSGSAVTAFARSESALAALSAVTRTRALMAADLGQAAGRVSLDLSGQPIQAFTLTPAGFVLVRRGVSGITPSVQKIAWGHDGSRLLRQTFPAVDGAPPGEAVTMLEDVREVQLRVDAGQGFTEQWIPRTPQDLPRAVELTLVPGRGAPITMLFLVAA